MRNFLSFNSCVSVCDRVWAGMNVYGEKEKQNCLKMMCERPYVGWRQR